MIEVNEAFASVALQFLRDAGLQERVADVNPNGGGISLGHPLGATGARITATLLNELERREARYGLATMCIGFGQAIAAVIERSVALHARKSHAREFTRPGTDRVTRPRGSVYATRVAGKRPQAPGGGIRVLTRARVNQKP